jgi:hypothetical protein
MDTKQTDTATGNLLLLDALRLLPGVKPLSVRSRLGEAKYWAGRAPSGIGQFEGISLKLADLEQLFIMDEQGRPCVSPAGAALLVDLYERGVFECVPTRKASGDLDLLAKYAKGEPVVLEKPPRTRAPKRPKTATNPKPVPRLPEAPMERSPINYAALTVHRLA